MSGDGSYAPKSPDLSSFYSTPAPAQSLSTHHQPRQDIPFTQQQQRFAAPQQSHHLQPPQTYYQPPPAVTSPSQPVPPQLQHQHHAPVAYAPQTPQYYTPAAPLHRQPSQPSQPSVPTYLIQPPQSPQQQQQQQYYPAFGEYSSPAQPPGYPSAQPYGAGPAFPQPKLEPEDDVKLDIMPRGRAATAEPPKPFIDTSPVRTKFPTARIKRIMQADEEVGKVAQQTPIAVGKALELFMVALVNKSADVAKEKNSKRVTAQMLKHVVETDDQWDFLREIVGKVENEEKGGKGSRAKAESESEEEDSKKKVKVGRKKKS